mmetsp:Transcript_9082/g.10082  ORF Transcript_9082/g.10082 Transcript_9082/m.10082 type:complete len:368 (-) Transcript_9082:153-1256(-)
MNFYGLSIEQALAYYRDNHNESLCKIKGAQHESFFKQVESILSASNASLVNQLKQLLFKHTNVKSLDNTNHAINDNNSPDGVHSEDATASKHKKTKNSHVTKELNILDFPPEVIANILHHTEAKDRFPVAQSCHLMADIIHDVVGYKQIYLRRIQDIRKIKQCKGIMKNSNIEVFNIRDTVYSLLAGCRNISVFSKGLNEKHHIYDSDLQLLSKDVQYIDLTNCKYITDEGIQALARVHTIGLNRCNLVTDEGIKALKGLHAIHLHEMPVTDRGIEALNHVHTIQLSCCSNVTDEGIKALKGVHAIRLEKISVTDKGIRFLKGVHTVDLNNCAHVTNEGIMALKGAHNIKIFSCCQVTERGIQEHIS